MKAWVAAAALATAASLHDEAVREDWPAPLYSADPADPWNRIHHLLFTRRLKASVVVGTEAVRHVERVEGGDLPTFMVMPEAGYLLEEPRYGRLTRALGGEIAAPSAASRTLEARVLFQQDLWNRFDAVDGFLSLEHPAAKRERAHRLRELLGRTMARVACAPAELLRIPSSLGDAAREFPEVLDPRTFAPDSGWKELVSTGGDGPVESGTTEHARSAGYRIVFRRFVRLPETAGGAACLAEAVAQGRRDEGGPQGCSDHALPDGTRTVLLETPLALATDASLTPVPLIVGLQSRTVASPGAFQVLHASRAAVARRPLRAGGLEALPQDALIPMTASAFRRVSGQALVPLKAACPACHGARGEALGTGRLQVRPRTQVLLPDNSIEQDRVARAKRADAAYATLRDLFAAN